MLESLTKEKREDIESLCKHIEGHLYNLREALHAADVERVHAQAEKIEGWGIAIKHVCEGKE